MSCLRFALLTAFLLIGLGLKAAPDWGPIPASAWNIKSGSPEAVTGAVVLYEKLRFNPHDMEWWFRVRIVSESGKSAAEFSGFPDRPSELVGRTIYPDGKVVEFNSKKDFKISTATVGSFQVKRTTVIPPGVTKDCIVEVYYRDTVPWRVVAQWDRRLMRSHPIEMLSVEFASLFPSAWNLKGVKNFRPQSLTSSGETRLLFPSLPAGDNGPYLIGTDLDEPRLVIYSLDSAFYDAAGEGSDAYWKKFATLVAKPSYQTRLEKGRPYPAFAKEVLANLPSVPEEAVKLIFDRVHARIHNLNRQTWEQVEQRKKNKLKTPDRVTPGDLGETVDFQATNDQGMIYLIFQLLSEANLQPRLLFLADRNQRMFDYRQKNRFQITNVLLCVDSPGKGTLLLDPIRWYMPPGLVNQDFHGTFGLLVDPKDWSVRSFGVPANSEAMNTQIFAYHLQLEGDRLNLRAKVEFSGQQGFQRRLECLRSEPAERDRNLKEDFEKRANGWLLTEAKVVDAVDPSKPLAWSLGGSTELESGDRMTIAPFPGMQSPYFLPDVWPESRDARIVLPYLKTHRAECRLTLPKGLRVRVMPELNETNLFGQVKWTLGTKKGPQGTEVTVAFEVIGRTLTAPSEDYGLLRDFMGWIGDAMGRSIVIERGE